VEQALTGPERSVSASRSPARRRSWLRTLTEALALIVLIAAVYAVMARLGIAPVEEMPPGRLVAIDGDTLRGPDGDIRLYGIDAPELHQTCEGPKGRDYPCGRDARNRLDRLTRGKALACEVRDTDRFGRAVSVCRAGDLDINRQMVTDGWAVAYPGRTDYEGEEAEARDAARGLWSGAFQPPKAWRREHPRGP
jgi:endonuclease YncB( thermonuclease family)